MGLRWKKHKKLTGLQAISAGPRSSDYHDGTRIFAIVYPLRDNRRRAVVGWYFVVPSGNGMAYCNTCDKPVADEATAKRDAEAHVKAALQKLKDEEL
jgi:hypothetical protein